MAGSKDHFLALVGSAQGDLGKLLTLNEVLQKAALACADNGDLVQDRILNAYRQEIAKILPQVQDGRTGAAFIILLMALVAAQQGREAGLDIGLQASITPECEKANTVFLYRLMRMCGWFDRGADDYLRKATDKVRIDLQSEDLMAYHICTRGLRFLGLASETDKNWTENVANHVALPWMEQAVAKRFYNTAIQCEMFLYDGWVRQYEIMDHYQKSFSRWADRMYAAGKSYAQTLPLIETQSRKRPLIGIFAHNSAWLAHIDLLYQTLRMTTDREYDLCIYFFSSRDDNTLRKFADINVKSVFLDDQDFPPAPVERLAALRLRLAQDGVRTLLWLCHPTLFSFAMGMRLAPQQVYWSMKHPISALIGADSYWTSHNSEHLDIYERRWKTTPVTYAATATPTDTDIQAIRAQFPEGAILLGTIAREEKLNSPAFLDAISAVLKNHPHTYYLYTSRTDASPIQSHFAAQGVGERARCVGWIDPRLYAQVFDIYADCWPARSGMTAFAALEAQIPIVFNAGATENHDFVRLFYFYHQLEKREDGYHLPDPALDADFTLPDGRRGLLACNDAGEYIKTIGQLIDDPVYRKACGKTGRILARRLTDTSLPAKKVDDLFHQLIRDAA